MYRLSSIIAFILICFSTKAQNPHGTSFAIDCAACHNASGWEIDIDTFAFGHDTMSFALQGVHLSVDCKECHSSLTFDQTPLDCMACHSDMHSGSVGNDCARCHNAENWLVDAIPELHEENGFPLVGAHSVLNCIDCHLSETQLRFDRIGNDCINCHIDEFNETSSPNHMEIGFSMNCIECHDPLLSSWETDIVNHDFFPLTGGHDLQDCKLCHVGESISSISADCVSCHVDDFTSTTNPLHNPAAFSSDCLECHTTDPGWKPARFDNHNSVYALNGAHAVIANECVACHANGFANTPNTCIGCHQSDFNQTDDPDHVAAGFPTECLECHTEQAWTPAEFDHNNIYALNGAHAVIANECVACHANGFNNTPNTCIGCHQTDFNQTDDPDHLAAGFPTECLECHTEQAWTPAEFDHNNIYSLNGAHAVIANECVACHANGFTNTPNTCIGCHQTDFNQTDDPDHVAAGFPAECLECHTEQAWTPAEFDHNNIFVLNGAHAVIANECVACHANGFNNTPNTCIGCHQTDFNQTDDPDHVAAGFPTECLECHTEQAWTPAEFDHNNIFVLNGAHAVIANECVACHANGFNNTPNTCIGCHQSDFNQTDDPDHVAAGFPTECLECHSEQAWTPAEFDHNNIYALNGAHALIANECVACHANGFANTPNTCIGCHQSDFNQTDDPDHVAAGFPTECLECHTEQAWTPAEFDHNNIYALNGAHALIANECVACHANGFNNTPNTCIGCHQTDFNQTDDPDHVAAGFPTECLECHTEQAWTPAEFDHNNIYALNGAHALIANECVACHANGFTNTPNTCIGCHQTDFNQTDDPDHVAAGFPTECLECHTEQAWTPAEFDHNNIYALNGAHAVIANECVACHANGFANTPNTCIGCHQSDFNATRDPDHQSANFPVECEQCHGENSWTPASFNHDANNFPIYIGRHDGEWNNCAECHLGGNLSMFSCINCHEHNDRNEVDEDHEDVSAYEYQSNACLACHPTGEE